jgi:hypothetical protein
MFRNALKLLVIAIIITLIPIVIFSYEIFSASEKIFISDQEEISVVKQFSDLIFSPAQSLSGEERAHRHSHDSQHKT